MDTTTMITRCAVRYQDENFDNKSAAAWLGYLNDAYRDVLSANPLWPFLKQTTTLTVLAGQRSVALPTNVFKLTSVYNSTDQYPMRAIEGGTQHIRLYPDQTLDGVSSRYRVFNDELQVWPLPDYNVDIIVDYIVAPSDLGSAAATVITSVTGAAAGDHTITIDAADILFSVVAVNDTTHAIVDLTSEFVVTATNTINNTGGTNTTGYHLVVTYTDVSVATADTPVFPAQWHNILVESALSRAYIDDTQPNAAAVYQATYKTMLTNMVADLLAGQQDRNPEIVDSWY